MTLSIRLEQVFAVGCALVVASSLSLLIGALITLSQTDLTKLIQ